MYTDIHIHIHTYTHTHTYRLVVRLLPSVLRVVLVIFLVAVVHLQLTLLPSSYGPACMYVCMHIRTGMEDLYIHSSS